MKIKLSLSWLDTDIIPANLGLFWSLKHLSINMQILIMRRKKNDTVDQKDNFNHV